MLTGDSNPVQMMSTFNQRWVGILSAPVLAEGYWAKCYQACKSCRNEWSPVQPNLQCASSYKKFLLTRRMEKTRFREYKPSFALICLTTKSTWIKLYIILKDYYLNAFEANQLQSSIGRCIQSALMKKKFTNVLYFDSLIYQTRQIKLQWQNSTQLVDMRISLPYYFLGCQAKWWLSDVRTASARNLCRGNIFLPVVAGFQKGSLARKAYMLLS